MVGDPEKWSDYSEVKSYPVDLYGNAKWSSAVEYEYALADLNKPVDRKKWAMNPQTVNAYNGGLENKIVFPAGILQAPYFSESVDDAVNYGAIGRSEEHTSELQSLMRISYAVFCLKKKTQTKTRTKSKLNNKK